MRDSLSSFLVLVCNRLFILPKSVMAQPGVMVGERPFDAVEAPELPPKKRFKVSELPLSSSQKAAIDGLLHTIKKKGLYDTVRKQVWAQYTESVSGSAQTTSIKECAHL